MELKLITDKQKEQLKDIISYYKRFYICNRCGTLYGSDSLEKKDTICPVCEEDVKKKKASSNC